MDDVIQVQDQFYILATASRSAQRTAVLKHDDSFAVFDYSGDIGAFGTSEQGLYHEGTRYLSRFSHASQALKSKGRPRKSLTSPAAGFEPAGASTVSR